MGVNGALECSHGACHEMKLNVSIEANFNNYILDSLVKQIDIVCNLCFFEVKKCYFSNIHIKKIGSFFFFLVF